MQMTLYEGGEDEKRDDCFTKIPESSQPMDDSDEEVIFEIVSPN
jgi:hypothetical protein